MKRTSYCGALRETNVNQIHTVMGWVQNKRDMGGVIFIDLRDREGILQVVFDGRNLTPEAFAAAEALKLESVIAVEGPLRIRGEETYNPKLVTGTIELAAKKLEVLSEAAALPFSMSEAGNVREELRLQYRFLDLRRPKLLNNLKFRHRLTKLIHDYLDGQGFLQVETPMLTKSTPEGARDYLVPSRVHQGMFYALPQSPQIFKQLLMVGGVDKYYQIARCFRDEDLRADRQPEFTQVDMELSFVDQEDILEHLEKMFKHLFREALGVEFQEPFPRLTWQQAMDRYGSDKPDLRFGLPIVDLTQQLKGCGFSVFRKAIDEGGMVRAVNVKGHGNFTRSAIEELTEKALKLGAKGMAWIALKDDGEPYSILTKYFSQEEFQSLLDAVDGKPGDFILFCADQFSTVCRTLGGLRLELADMLGLRKPGDYRFLIVTDFPEFEYSQEEGRYLATHHPFTMPYPEDIPYLISDPARVRAQAYDVVLNGVELGSGSMRIHQKDVQRKMFEALGFSEEQIQERFGFMVNAFQYGTPPHGGFAFGLDRLAMQMLEAESLRDVIAFPKNKDAVCPMTQAPNVVDPQQLEVLGLAALLSKEGTGKAVQKRQRPKIDVENVANLSKLLLSPEEKEAAAKDMEEIVEFANQLQAIDTENIPAAAHTAKLTNVFREDIPRQSCPRELLLENAPEQHDGCVFVPQVVE
ncbi:aspartate--tRNA ligase [[Clostridium] leptum DSM 753]|uniref:Multifunctional fusion protein n=1 Tax=[Clostridium] leptum DSM 753 TaxID=428125 RepID=A7VUA1_9FIRM|nr:aspartate--tRNA ligase [[Clostridium] leptum DSM 753]PEQ24810.1 Asp-tRNA(Asn)/Glu-tRNA(Gln) amidotransferase GatCAB subunit C [[Clostridium] leptum DSM 753]